MNNNRPKPRNAGTTSDFIVFLNDNPGQGNLAAKVDALLKSLGESGEPIALFENLGNAFVLNITEKQANRLRALGGVKSVEADAEVFLEPPIPGSKPDQVETDANNALGLSNYQDVTFRDGGSVEYQPWGVGAVWQDSDIRDRGNFGEGKYAFVIDSGVRDTTGDLNITSNTGWNRSWVDNNPTFDGNGHGTHVAGTIAALINGRGVIGVAPGAEVVSLKVFDSSGAGGTYSNIIEAVDHATGVIKENGLEANSVVNMSLGGPAYSGLDDALRAAASQGVKFAVAAGNSGDDADKYSPAGAGDNNNIYTISAVNNLYQMSSWSNWDKSTKRDSVDDVDFAAPGVSVLSYYTNGLAYLSGTSMASPHAAGLLLAGGITAGEMVIPYMKDTADPFAIGNSSESPNPGTPEYAITSPQKVDEDANFSIELSTKNVDPSAELYWSIGGTNIETSDFVNLDSLLGSITVETDGSAIIQLETNGDQVTEGDETFTFTLYSNADRTNQVGENSITIIDTSTDSGPVEPPSDEGLVLWGTINSEVIMGYNGNDQLTGVLETGTSFNAMGGDQIDTLTGGSGEDIFVLGDTRGVFYNDRNRKNLGTSDYVLITDFISGVDKLQLFGDIQDYFYNSSTGELFWDANNSGSFESRGRSKDELFAVLQNGGNLFATDIIFVQ